MGLKERGMSWKTREEDGWTKGTIHVGDMRHTRIPCIVHVSYVPEGKKKKKKEVSLRVRLEPKISVVCAWDLSNRAVAYALLI